MHHMHDWHNICNKVSKMRYRQSFTLGRATLLAQDNVTIARFHQKILWILDIYECLWVYQARQCLKENGWMWLVCTTLPDVLISGHLKISGPMNAIANDSIIMTLLYCSPNSSNHLWSFGLLWWASSVNWTILLSIDSFHVLEAWVRCQR